MEKISADLPSQCQVYPSQIGKGKSMARNGMIALFADNKQKENKGKDLFLEELYREIGQFGGRVGQVLKKSGLTNQKENIAYRAPE